MQESALYEHLARYMRYHHPTVPFHFDLGGVNNPSRYTRTLYSRLNGRAWPDMFVAAQRYMPGTTDLYGGLFIELKKEGVRLRKRNGEWASEHIAEQAEMLERLSSQGFCAVFATGFDSAVEVIESYLNDGATNAEAGFSAREVA